MNTVEKVMNYTGKYGPFILFFPTAFFLSNKKNAMIYYVTGFFLNSITNVCLKLLIQQPRPSDDKQKFDLALQRGKQFLFLSYDVFGMPSGHSQSVAFTVFFVFLTIQNIFFRFFCAMIALITLWQRVKYNYHTVLQVVIGTMVGALIAYLMFYMKKMNIIGLLKEKHDDNAPL